MSELPLRTPPFALTVARLYRQMMQRQQLLGWALLSLVATTLVMPVYAQTQHDYYQARLQRKFVNKPNHIKKQGYYAGPEVPGIEKVGLRGGAEEAKIWQLREGSP